MALKRGYAGNVDPVKHSDAEVLVWGRTAIPSTVARDLRIDAGLSLAEVGRAIGVSSSAISRWETHQRVPRGEAAIRYFNFLLALANTLAKKPVAA